MPAVGHWPRHQPETSGETLGDQRERDAQAEGDEQDGDRPVHATTPRRRYTAS